jgi:hypothetical protein
MFLSETCFGTEFLKLASIFFFYGTEFRAFFSSAERFGTEFREFSVPRNGLERNSESLLLLLFPGTECRAFFSSAERFGESFYLPRNSRNSAGTNQLFRLFRLPRNNFFVGNCQPYLVGLGIWVSLKNKSFLCSECRQYGKQ